ncbi:MAG TPA: cupin domain-containing protein [Candidatus Sulfotelmatobacter sp.]|nr:cupin domain-containing protein [Candidatus Sulfotelmatobacter sp.]
MTTSVSPTPLVAAKSGEELRAWLAPVTPETFVREYFARKPLYVKGFPGKYAGFFDREAFGRALAPGPVAPDYLRASFDQKTEAGTSGAPRAAGELRSSAFRAGLDQAVPLFDAGATLCVSQIETRVTELAPFVAAIKRQLGFPGKVSFNAYLSPEGSGYNWHFDGRIASTLQIEGTKTWRFSNHPALTWPRANGSIRADGTPQYADPSVSAQPWERLTPFDEDDVTEVLMEPGDLLILPAGVWHEACGGSGGSLALNLSFTPVSYTQLVGKLLDAALLPEAGWRGPAPVLPGATPGEVDADGVAAISAQLARAAEVLQSLSGDAAAVVRLWQSFVQNGTVAAAMPLAQAHVTTPVQPEQRLRVRSDGNLTATLADGGRTLCLLIGTNRELELVGPAVHFVRRVLAAREFRAADAAQWSDNGAAYAWDDVQTLLTNLAKAGLLEDAPAD